jgi:hypothetical protein
MSLVGLRIKNQSAGEGQQQFSSRSASDQWSTYKLQHDEYSTQLSRLRQIICIIN